ncbi:MAG: NTP transferase domain-containing protein [Planctomycetaceae bacterium]|jgi:bifunctional UDP-N-acetylglucosamine pyrophosphorylase/glucosamine-1-phosphate N-acetyltransferase/UDP-N-acetylglucosamine pyrophosphorylase|nr:NTP transferase domain-containing protein [Planctomycetaceae bacterium]
MTENQYAVVMAAGKGTRMKSELPKVLYPVCGRPMIEYVLDTLEKANIGKVVVVVGYRSDLVRKTLAPRLHRNHLVFVEQTEQLGTGHAVMVCRNELQNHTGATLVVAGDCPMIQVESILKLFEAYTSNEKPEQISLPSCILGTVIKDDPVGLGRIVRNREGEFVGIVEEKDANTEQKRIKEVNMSYYVFHTPDLLNALNHLRTDNAQKEYYVTDVPAVMKSQGQRVIALPVLKPIESLGINTVDEAKIVEAALQNL